MGCECKPLGQLRSLGPAGTTRARMQRPQHAAPEGAAKDSLRDYGTAASANGAINAHEFYGTYHGHQSRHLAVLEPSLRRGRSLIWLAGDSSVDNKHWFGDCDHAVNGYEHVLSPPRSTMDVAFWLNKLVVERGLETRLAAINTAVEESTLGARACCRLLPQDRFLRDHVQAGDTVVVSVGGNDIALAPAPCTIVNMLALAKFTPTSCIEGGFGCALPIDDCCCGCGPGCLSTLLACPPGLGYFIHLFKVRMEAYLRNLTAVQRPRRILVCMIYFLDEASGGSWADITLASLGYNSNPAHLQAIIRRVFELATQQICIPGTEIVPVPFFEALDGKDTDDYVQRVEPSATGGRKLANLILDKLAESEGAAVTPPSMDRKDA